MEGKTVLVVDDEADLREALSTALSGAGATVLEAKDGEEGYEIAQREHPDVILMDINMPGMSGHDVVQKLRIDPWGNTVPVIYLTSNSDAANIVEAVSSGGNEYIVKSNMSLKDVIDKCKQALLGYEH